MVAACSNALTGEGPAMASGNQVCSGTCADLPSAPMSSNKATRVAMEPPAGQEPRAISATASSCSVPSSKAMISIAIINAVSPMRVTMNALRPAAALAGSLYQKPMSRYEHTPTPSQPR